MPKATPVKHYRKEWESLAECRGWLANTDGVGAFCKVCRRSIRNHIGEIRKHGESAKHKKLRKMSGGGKIRAVIKTKHAGAYNKEWEQDADCRGWLEELRSVGAAFCKYCKCEMNPHITDLKRHARTLKHVEAVRELQQRLDDNRPHGARALCHVPEVRKRQLEYRVALHLAVDTVFRGSQELCHFMRNELGENRFGMVGEECGPIVETSLSTLFREQLANDMKEAPFSLILDETARLATAKAVAACTRYFSTESNKIVTAFLGDLTLVTADVAGVADAIVNLIDEWSLEGKNMIGLVTDGIVDLCPERGALLSVLRINCPNVVHLHSTFAAVTLAFNAAAKKHLSRELEYLLRESHNWFAQSHDRQAKYASIVDFAGFSNVENIASDEDEFAIGKSLRIIEAGMASQWMDIAAFLPFLLGQFEALKTHFVRLAETGACYQAKLLADMYKNDRLRILLHVVNPALRDLREMKQLFEEMSGSGGKLSEPLGAFFIQMASKIMHPEPVDTFTPDELCDVVLDSASLLPIGDVGFDEEFKAALLDSSLNLEERKAMRENAFKFMQELFVGMQGILKDSLIVLRSVESFHVENFLQCPLERTSLIGPFFGQTEGVSKSVCEDAI
jgi:hypothetical protein